MTDANEKQARLLVRGVKIFGYYEDGTPEEGSLFPFSDEAAAIEHANSVGLPIDEITLWKRAATDEEKNLIEFGAWLALEDK